MAGGGFECMLAGASTSRGEMVDIGMREGRIAAVGCLDRRLADECIDARGLSVLPGVIDSHVHFREPGGEEAETLESGSRAAVLGGVCTVFDMPNTRPPVTSQAALDAKFRLAEGRMHTDYAFFVGATRDNLDWLPDAEARPGVSGVKLFMGSSTGELLVDDDAGVRAVLEAGRRRVAVHSEDEARLRRRRPVEGDPASHPTWRDAETARLSTERLLRLAREAGRRIHLLHLTSADELPVVAAFREDCPDLLTVEVTPHHLVLESETAYASLGTLAQVNPPVRGRRHRDALRAALFGGGVIDTVASDHAPHTLESKRRPYPRSPSGVPGTATLLPILLDFVAKGHLDLRQVEEVLCLGPARVFGLRSKGRVSVGYDADLTLVDLGRRETIRSSSRLSRAGWSPFDGMTVRGWPRMTFLRGRRVMAEGDVIERPGGRPVEFRAGAPS